MMSKGFVNRKYVKIINSYIDSFIINHNKLCINLVYNMVNIIALIALYPLIPIFMCYGGNIRELSKAMGYSYNIQFIIASLTGLIISFLVITIVIKDIDKWNKLLRSKEVDAEIRKEIRKESINLPYKIYICQTFVMIFSTALISIVLRIILNFPMILIFKLNIIVFSFSFFTAVISYTFSKKIFSRILVDTYFDSKADGVRVDIKTKMFLQIIPIIIATSLLIALLGYSRVIEEKGDILYESYKLQLQDRYQFP
ncbi:MAG TPA: hypothetical protein VIK72_04795 [Clostridiaceae bacterium]